MEPYPALKKELNLKSRQEEIEVDYLHKLNKEELEFLNKFNAEYVNAEFEDRKNLDKNIHNTIKLKKACDKRNNERMCQYTRAKATNRLKYIDDENSNKIVIENYEDILIDKLDRKIKPTKA